MNSVFFENNRKRYFDKIERNSMTVLFSGRETQQTGDQDYTFEVNRNFYYLTGINQPNVILCMIKGQASTRTALFLEENDPVLVKWVGKKLEKSEASAISGINSVFYLPDFDNFIYGSLNQTRKNTDTIEYMYCDLERRPYDGYSTKGLEFAKSIKDKYVQLQVKNAYNVLIGLRMYKTEEEIDLIKASIATTKGGIESLMSHAREGLYEYQLESYFDHYIKFNGQKNVSFHTIAASGKNATVLHYNANNTVIKNDQLILFDLGCCTEHYISDISRTFPVGGKFSPRQKEIYQSVLNVNKKCIEFLKPGLSWADYNNYANKLIAEELIKLGLITDAKDFNKYYYHSIGHFIGLDTHDPGLHEFKFAPGMVMTVEPGIYVEEEGIGVRIEDNILITEDGCINLSKDIIKEVDDIEKYMTK